MVQVLRLKTEIHIIIKFKSRYNIYIITYKKISILCVFLSALGSLLQSDITSTNLLECLKSILMAKIPIIVILVCCIYRHHKREHLLFSQTVGSILAAIFSDCWLNPCCYFLRLLAQSILDIWRFTQPTYI